MLSHHQGDAEMQIDNFVFAERYIEREEPDGPFWGDRMDQGDMVQDPGENPGITDCDRCDSGAPDRSVPAYPVGCPATGSLTWQSAAVL